MLGAFKLDCHSPTSLHAPTTHFVRRTCFIREAIAEVSGHFERVIHSAAIIGARKSSRRRGDERGQSTRRTHRPTSFQVSANANAHRVVLDKGKMGIAH
jgi:hypothetical protein